MNILETYNKYHLPENLQMHMLRVAACSNLIVDNWIGLAINKDAIIRVCLLHDIGNIVKIPEEFSNEKKFLKVRKSYIDKYGANDHLINLEIGEIEGLSKEELNILDGKRSSKNEETLNSHSYERKICAYCDQRVAPDGVKDIKERLEDAKIRYKDKPLSAWSNEEKANKLIEYALEIEKQIMEYCTLKPSDINDTSIQEYVELLKKYSI